jgi:hypothetical protein
MESCPERDPVCVGVNVTATLHCPPAAIEEQLFVSPKSPVVLTAEMVIGAEPEFFKTTLLVLLEVFRSWLPNDSGAVDSSKTGTAATPVPESEKASGLFSALEFTVNMPLLAPVAVGVNTMLSVHVAWSARDARHELFDAI